ncbi:hypothetical protein GALMADRAFT_1124625 [Galerina marginata CBS 339.88]|uniref:Uncharacterized protein n=1 Tax=Galerina marginata (strain CBS 339.88) TaxID=685588 RepID=A0A067TMU3_GALM3|nr:hypothetical protein GALMADRAFT_1124625 [Galerina marginata CBS 339.88]
MTTTIALLATFRQPEDTNTRTRDFYPLTMCTSTTFIPLGLLRSLECLHCRTTSASLFSPSSSSPARNFMDVFLLNILCQCSEQGHHVLASHKSSKLHSVARRRRSRSRYPSPPAHEFMDPFSLDHFSAPFRTGPSCLRCSVLLIRISRRRRRAVESGTTATKTESRPVGGRWREAMLVES